MGNQLRGLQGGLSSPLKRAERQGRFLLPLGTTAVKNVLRPWWEAAQEDELRLEHGKKKKGEDLAPALSHRREKQPETNSLTDG